LNIVFYGERPIFISLGLVDNVHYLTQFANNFSVFVPGGYGRYKIGSLGKLAILEKKPAIIQNSFSSIVSAYIDFYFYPQNPKIYWEDSRCEFSPFGLLKIDQQTNANFFDRLYLFFFLLNKRKNDFSSLNPNFNVDEKNNFSEEDFFKKYQGYFYQQFLRQERKNLQIDYQNYQSAKVITRIVEGEGIRVVDLTKTDRQKDDCYILEKIESKTALFLAKIFGCKIEKGETGVGDIRMVLGKRLEREWE